MMGHGQEPMTHRRIACSATCSATICSPARCTYYDAKAFADRRGNLTGYNTLR